LNPESALMASLEVLAHTGSKFLEDAQDCTQNLHWRTEMCIRTRRHSLVSLLLGGCVVGQTNVCPDHGSQNQEHCCVTGAFTGGYPPQLLHSIQQKGGTSGDGGPIASHLVGVLDNTCCPAACKSNTSGHVVLILCICQNYIYLCNSLKGEVNAQTCRQETHSSNVSQVVTLFWSQ
jgi:hypothetical protein